MDEPRVERLPKSAPGKWVLPEYGLEDLIELASIGTFLGFDIAEKLSGKFGDYASDLPALGIGCDTNSNASEVK